MWRTLWLSLCLAWPLAGWAFGFDDVAALAQRQAAAPWQGAAAPMPDALARLTYDEAREIRYRPDHAVWRGGDYELQFFHRGYVQRDLVAVHLVEGDQVRRMGYDPAAWDFGRLGATRGFPLRERPCPADQGRRGPRAARRDRHRYRYRR